MAAPPNPTSEAIPYPNLAFGTGLTFGFGVRTALLYGVFVTEKSYLIGLRKLIKREHISMLISHVCGDRFPQEVVDIIEQSLYDLEKDIVDSAWKGNAEDNENIRKFLPGLYAPWPAQEATRAKLAATGVRNGIITHSKPCGWEVNPNAERLYHLSASKMPRVQLSLPDASVQTSNVWSTSPTQWTEYESAQGHSSAASWLHGPHVVSGDMITYFPSGTTKAQAGLHGEWQDVISRILHCSSIQQAICTWDANALKGYVDMLELEEVRLVGAYFPDDESVSSDYLQPTLHISQTLMYDDLTFPSEAPQSFQMFAGAKEFAKETRESWKAHALKLGHRIKGLLRRD